MKNKNVTLVCDDTVDGIMTAIYDGWVLMNKGCIVSIHPGKGYSATFFSEFITIDTNLDKSVRVAKSIRIKISIEAYMMVYRACMHFDNDKGNEIFEFLKLGYAVGARVTKMLTNPHVLRVTELSRKAVNEAHLFKGFVRFDELKGGVLYSRIQPKCDVVPLIINHFQDRFPEEDWIIYDSKRKKAAVHKHETDTIIVEGQDVEALTKDLQYNDEYRELWRIFFDTIGIDARKNPKCQRTQLPMWFRENMTEFVKEK